MSSPPLGSEVRRLRLEAGLTLRGLAGTLRVSAAHLSDIEHDRRRPSEKLLRTIARELEGVGARYEYLEELLTGIDPEMRDWVAATPGVRKLLRTLKESGTKPIEILPILEKAVVQRKSTGQTAIEKLRKKR